MGTQRVVDLSLPVRKTWRWPVDLSLTSSLETGGSSQVTSVTLRSHWYTHTDAPKHKTLGGKTLDDFPLERLVGEALILDLTFAGPDQGLDAKTLDEALGGRATKDILILRTDWPKKISWETFEFWDHAPYVTEDGAKWLFERHPRVVGFDFPQDHDIRLLRLEPHAKRKMPVHDHVLANDILMIEYLTNLWEVGSDSCTIVALPLKLEHADGAPTRVIAIV